jgi:hypothetical protein
MSLAELTVESFTGRVQETFTLAGPAAALKLVLAEVEELGQSQNRKAFSLRFLGPPQPILPQATYRLEHPAMGALEIFLVPLGPRDGGMRYEAVFA